MRKRAILGTENNTGEQGPRKRFQKEKINQTRKKVKKKRNKKRIFIWGVGTHEHTGEKNAKEKKRAVQKKKMESMSKKTKTSVEAKGKERIWWWGNLTKQT